MKPDLTVIGGGLAGCEAALWAAGAGLGVLLLEMKPARRSPAHASPLLGELVCSNSLRSADPASAVGLLKEEMTRLGSRVMAAALATRVAAGQALAVDRDRFAAHLDRAVAENPRITRVGTLVERLPGEGLTILATGPLTEEPLASDLARLTGGEGLHFYDAIAPIVTAESVDPALSFWADRYGEAAGGDYLNCPLSEEEYARFHAALLAEETVPLKDFEAPRFFEGCLPIEVMAGRGPKTLLFGPMKPVGLVDPRTARRPFAVVQLRRENEAGTLLNLVGFQTKLTHPAQERVFRLIPALARARFARLGSIHRNTFLDAPRLLDRQLRLRAAPHLRVAGQLSGVEGYVESAASGLLAAIFAVGQCRRREIAPPPPETALGGLLAHLANTTTPDFQPSNVNFGLLPPLTGKRPKKDKKLALRDRAREALGAWIESQVSPLANNNIAS